MSSKLDLTKMIFSPHTEGDIEKLEKLKKISKFQFSIFYLSLHALNLASHKMELNVRKFPKL